MRHMAKTEQERKGEVLFKKKENKEKGKRMM
jgi:hypothetical protein